MLRAAVDTNIFLRALIKPSGSVSPVIHKLRDREYTLIYAQPLLDELVAKLALPRIRRKYRLTQDDTAALIALILLRGEPMNLSGEITVCRDPKDNFLLETAVKGRADYLVTGDKDLLVLHPFEGVQIVQPAQFLRAVDQDRRGK